MMRESAADLRAIVEIITLADRWIVLTHVKPDGDTIGSTAALVSLGNRLSKRVFWGGRDAIPTHYAFLDPQKEYQQINCVPDIPESERSKTVILCADTSLLDRSVHGILSYRPAVPVVNIDHHKDNDLFGSINWIDPSASATGEMVTELILAGGWGITENEANYLYTALVSDNGGFRYASTTPQSHSVAISLIEAGASPSFVNQQLEQNMSLGALHLWGIALSRAEVFAGGRAALFWLTRQDFEKTQTSPEETDSLVNMLLRLVGVDIVALCTENKERIRINLRAHAPCNARELACRMDGGGHDLAAGCHLALPMEKALEKLKIEMTTHVESLNSAY